MGAFMAIFVGKARQGRVSKLSKLAVEQPGL